MAAGFWPSRGLVTCWGGGPKTEQVSDAHCLMSRLLEVSLWLQFGYSLGVIVDRMTPGREHGETP